MATKNEKAALARAQAQKKVNSSERRTTVIIVAVSAVALVLFAGIVFFIVNSAKVPELTDAHAPAPADATGGIPVGTGGVAGVDVPTDVTRLDIYIDLRCPVCKQFEQINAADIDELRESGKVAVYYHPISILDHVSMGTAYSTRSASAVAAVADQDPSHFLQFIAALYADQPPENTVGLDDDQIAAIAVSVGVPEDVASKFKNGEFIKWVTASTDQAGQDGVGGTPTIMINREVVEQADVPYFQEGALKAYLDAVVEGAPTAAPTTSAKP